jgi:Trypsin-like peptidase domain
MKMARKAMKATNDEAELGGAEQFRRLTADGQARYIAHAQRMTTFARDHAIPIIFAPPVSAGGTVNGGTGFVLKINSACFVVTASHVLEKYEERLDEGEVLNWQVGKLPPFDPLSRIAWRDTRRDIVLLGISPAEERGVGPCLSSSPTKWPPRKPEVGQMVLVAGYPGKLREVDPSGWIGAGPYSALFRVASVGDGYCKCRIEHRDLVSFCETPVPPPGTKIGGVSGGPVLLVGEDYPIVGVVREHWYMDSAGLELLEFATLEDVQIE